MIVSDITKIPIIHSNIKYHFTGSGKSYEIGRGLLKKEMNFPVLFYDLSMRTKPWPKFAQFCYNWQNFFRNMHLKTRKMVQGKPLYQVFHSLAAVDYPFICSSWWKRQFAGYRDIATAHRRKWYHFGLDVINRSPLSIPCKTTLRDI